MRRILMVLAACLLFAATAWADQAVYRYGGSGREYLDDIDVSADGRILMTGYTDSTDGTLCDRTKTGRTGRARGRAGTIHRTGKEIRPRAGDR